MLSEQGWQVLQEILAIRLHQMNDTALFSSHDNYKYIIVPLLKVSGC